MDIGTNFRCVRFRSSCAPASLDAQRAELRLSIQNDQFQFFTIPLVGVKFLFISQNMYIFISFFKFIALYILHSFLGPILVLVLPNVKLFYFVFS